VKRLRSLIPLAAVVMALLSGPGCTSPITFGKLTLTPRDQLAAAHDLYAATCNTVAVLGEAGRLDKKEILMADMLAEAGLRCLDSWGAAIELGQSPGDLMRQFNEIIREMVTLQMAADRRRNTP